MKSDKTRVILCNCASSMPLDGEAIAHACGVKETGQTKEIYTSLCYQQTDKLAQIISETPEDERVLIACTQQQHVFDAFAQELDKPAPSTVNIRETAGWSDDAKKATPKIAALIKSALRPVRPTRSLAMTSHGRCLIYGGGEAGLRLGQALQHKLGVTVMLLPDSQPLAAEPFTGQLTRGRIKQASGYFTQFTLSIDQFCEGLPFSRTQWAFSEPTDGVESSCDILIDLTGETPLFTGSDRRDGYFRCQPDDLQKLARIEREATEMIGDFEKPIYVRFDETVCAHSRNGLTGCSRCLDVCPAGAITSIGDHVAIDPGICGGCGFCGAVCPSGAAQTDYPAAETLLESLSLYLSDYRDAGGKSPVLLLHDGMFGSDMISMIARHGRGLPAHVIPFELHSIGRTGHDLLAGAVGLGFEQIFILMNPNHADEKHPLEYQISLTEHLLAGVNVDAQDRIILIQEADPELAEQILWTAPSRKKYNAAAFVPAGSPRALTRLSLRGLARTNNAKSQHIPLPDGAPYGRLEIDTEKCTICLSCVGACPAGALQDNPDAPQLLFREDACLQCGIWAKRKLLQPWSKKLDTSWEQTNLRF